MNSSKRSLFTALTLLLGCVSATAQQADPSVPTKTNRSRSVIKSEATLADLLTTKPKVMVNAVASPIQAAGSDQAAQADEKSLKQLKDFFREATDLEFMEQSAAAGNAKNQGKVGTAESSTDVQSSTEVQSSADVQSSTDEDSINMSMPDGASASQLEGSQAAANDLARLDVAQLSSIRSISITRSVSEGILPENQAARAYDVESRQFQPEGVQRLDSFPLHFAWTAPSVAYRPLYFEDVWLERHGRSHRHLQPVVSAAKFYATLPALAYKVGATPCKECVYSLGLGRPGDCPPHFFTLPKKSVRGGIYQAAAIAGAILVIP